MASSSNRRPSAPVAVLPPESDNGLAFVATSPARSAVAVHSPTPAADSHAAFASPGPSRSHAHPDEVVDANRRRMAFALDAIEEVFLKTQKLSVSLPDDVRIFRDTSLPLPRGLLHIPIADQPSMGKDEQERRSLRPRSVRRSKELLTDSGIGSSIISCNGKQAADTSEKGNRSAASAITCSAAASANELLPGLSSEAVARIHQHTLRPLLKSDLEEFAPIVDDVPRRISAKEIICLRDLEKTLLFMAPEKAKTAALYLDFCLTSIRCIQATVEYLNDHEQIRPNDRPYSNGYFIDLKEQVFQYGRQLAAAKDKGNIEFDRNDEVKLYGGIAESSRPAELVRVKKDGTMISMATGRVIDNADVATPFKRSTSEQKEDEEEIMRSMARRKKNASPEELAPKRCREPGCTKEFKRPCDLTKHEKTHSRPWKCPIPTCKYHDFGWPTEKEMDRHVNDKHSDAPAMYECLFKPCPYKSKRESNCKQHMEKAHGWTYVRTKTNGKKMSSKLSSSAQQTPPLGDASTPSTMHSWNIPTPPQDQQPHMLDSDFPLYPNSSDWFATYGSQPDTIDNLDLAPDEQSPASSNQPFHVGPQFIMDDDIDIYAAPVHLPTQNVMLEQICDKIYQQIQPVPRQCADSRALRPQQFSPLDQENAMLYSPIAIQETDNGVVESFANRDAARSQTYFGELSGQGTSFQPFLGGAQEATMGFSQTSEASLFQQFDWTHLNCNNFVG